MSGRASARAWAGAQLCDGAESLNVRTSACPPAGEYIALYQSQRAVLKERHREKEEYINRLAQDKEEMKVGAPSVPGSGAGQGWGVRGLSASPSRSNCWSCRSWCSTW